MKILLCHSFYKQRGGEDLSFQDEAQMLRSNGHEVACYTRQNADLDQMSSLKAAKLTLWNQETYRELKQQIRSFRPDLLHCTNTFPLISPSVYQAAVEEHVPIVQALRNYRLLCPKGTMTRDSKVCSQCVGKRFAWPAIQHACYRDSRLASGVVASMLTMHKLRDTWSQVDRFFTPSRFARQVYIDAGMPEDRIDSKPNCVSNDPGYGPGNSGAGERGYAIFVGRLSPEKGISTLLEAWQQLPDSIQLRIIGQGPDQQQVEAAAKNDPRIVPLGNQPLEEVYRQLQSASCLIMPSVWYETFGRTIIEAYATGTPVIASRLGAMEELVEHEQTGLLFTPGSAGELARSVQQLCSTPNPEPMRHRARQAYLDNYTSEHSYQNLIQIYERTLGNKSNVDIMLPTTQSDTQDASPPQPVA